MKTNVAETMQSMVSSFATSRPIPHGEKRASTKAEKKEEGKVSAQVDKSILQKVRAISHQNNVSIRNIFETALEMYINAYESKHGTIQSNACRCDSAKDLI